ncbi:MAG TPA: arsenic resistance N-acetyltransferase ArsN2 [Longimicrobiaceae bacterium]|nr:arsenic resistance N-acetyltransferase ArsN2 [Longimicrobiaceae bacterium]
MTHALRAAGIRFAASDDLGAVLALLRACGLPTDGVEEVFPTGFIVSRDATGELEAVAGVEVHGAVGLLRSVAVRADRRGTGLGRIISVQAIEWARDADLSDLYLLTTTAESFFPRLGFERVERTAVPAVLNASAELQGACPASAIVMHLRLA